MPATLVREQEIISRDRNKPKLNLLAVRTGACGFYRIYGRGQGPARLELNGPWGRTLINYESLAALWTELGGRDGWQAVH